MQPKCRERLASNLTSNNMRDAMLFRPPLALSAAAVRPGHVLNRTIFGFFLRNTSAVLQLLPAHAAEVANRP